MFQIFKKIDKHARLMGTMADRVDVDLGEEVAEGHLRAEKYRESVMRCTRCNSVEDCQAFLATGEHADKAPEYCRNRGMFSELKA